MMFWLSTGNFSALAKRLIYTVWMKATTADQPGAFGSSLFRCSFCCSLNLVQRLFRHFVSFRLSSQLS
jgi:hypothetical protein